jgi:hypothetical protein
MCTAGAYRTADVDSGCAGVTDAGADCVRAVAVSEGLAVSKGTGEAEEGVATEGAAFEPVAAVAEPASAATMANASDACVRRTRKGTPMGASQRDRGEMRQSRLGHLA